MPVTFFIMTRLEITSRLVKSNLWFTGSRLGGVPDQYRLGVILGSVGDRVKIHKITPATGKERGDLEIKDYVVLQKPQEQTDRLPSPSTLILDFTMTHTRYGRSHVHPRNHCAAVCLNLAKPCWHQGGRSRS